MPENSKFLEAAVRLIRAAKRMVREGNIPQPTTETPFPYARELLEWTLNRKFSAGEITSPDEYFFINLGPMDEDDQIGERATWIVATLEVLGLTDLNIPEWKELNIADGEYGNS